MASLKIQELPEQDRPRERLTRLGAGALSDSELIAILLRTGMVGANAIDVANQLLKEYRTLGGLARCTVEELSKIKGVGPAKSVQLAAAFGLASRLARETLSRQTLDTPELVHALLGAEMRALSRESLRVILLDAKLQHVRTEEVSNGSLNESIAHPREIFRPAFLYAAYAIIVVHNHPSGDPTPERRRPPPHPPPRRSRHAPANPLLRPHHHRLARQRPPALLQLPRSGRDLKRAERSFRTTNDGADGRRLATRRSGPICPSPFAVPQPPEFGRKSSLASREFSSSLRPSFPRHRRLM